eukprot:m.38338 g.38338  ORF g.38338 m.38338 type:complete len:99 (+) comp32565_c0_seq3:527-823(+)
MILTLLVCQLCDFILQYIDHLVKVSNDKMAENNRRISRFYEFMKLSLTQPPIPRQKKETKRKVEQYPKTKKIQPEQIKSHDSTYTIDEMDLDLLWDIS